MGDCAWVLSRIQSVGETFNFIIPDGLPQRGKQIFDLLPQIANSCTYGSGLSYRKIDENNILHSRTYWAKIIEKKFYLSANTHLETGNRIEKFLPDLPVSYTLNFQTTDKDNMKARGLMNEVKHYVGIYTSAYGTTRNWGFWDEKLWFELIERVYRKRMDSVFVIIGASWDVDLSNKLMDMLLNAKIPFINTVGQPLPVVIEIMKLLDYGFYFPSGLPIIGEYIKVKGSVMFYPPHLRKMINSWADLERTESGVFKECLFCTPKEIFNWCIENKKF